MKVIRKMVVDVILVLLVLAAVMAVGVLLASLLDGEPTRVLGVRLHGYSWADKAVRQRNPMLVIGLTVAAAWVVVAVWGWYQTTKVTLTKEETEVKAKGKPKVKAQPKTKPKAKAKGKPKEGAKAKATATPQGEV